MAKTAIQDESGFFERLTRKLSKQYAEDEDALRKELASLSARNAEIDELFLSLYADKSKGVLSEQRFLKMTDALEQEQGRNKSRMQEIDKLLREFDSRESDVRQFVEEIRQYSAISELDEVILNRLIYKILIGAVEVVDGEKVRKVRIIYNFVGELYTTV